MTVIFGPSPVSIKAGTQTWGPVSFADSITTVTCTLAHWTGNQTLSFAVDLSFDSGSTWLPFGSLGTTGPPFDKHGAAVPLTCIFQPWRLCGFVFPSNSRYRPNQTCGEPYTPNNPANVQLLVHSDYAFQDISGLPNLSPITFHDPDLTPLAGPSRQVRITTTASGNISSTLTVDVV